MNKIKNNNDIFVLKCLKFLISDESLESTSILIILYYVNCYQT